MSYASKIHTNEGQTGLSNATNKDVDNPTTVRLHLPRTKPISVHISMVVSQVKTTPCKTFLERNPVSKFERFGSLESQTTYCFKIIESNNDGFFHLETKCSLYVWH